MDGAKPVSLAARPVDAYSARFVLRLPWSGPGESPLIAVRNRLVGDGLHEDPDITNYGQTSVELEVELRIDADFADLFDVKLGGSAPSSRRRLTRRRSADEQLFELEHVADGYRRATEVQLSGRIEELTEAGARFLMALAPGSSWHTCLDVYLNLDGTRSQPKCRCDALGTLSVPLAKRATAWRERFPRLHSARDSLNHLYGQSDLAALLMEDPDGAGDLVVAAGLPWLMALFGRDAILTALIALPFDRELAAGVLRTLARHQGEREDEASEEQPGRILHG